jgi:nitroreductase
MNIEEVHHLIRNRRSLYPAQYTGEKIDDSIVQEILENANWAPTHKHTEPWRFIVFTEGGLVRLADYQSSFYRENALAADNYNEEKYQKLKNNPLKASHVIAIIMKRDPKESVPEIEEIESVACAVQNMYLTASAYGLGAYWGSGGVTYMEEAKPFFGLDEKDRLLGFFYIGKVREGLAPKGRRNPIEEKVSWVNTL